MKRYLPLSVLFVALFIAACSGAVSSLQQERFGAVPSEPSMFDEMAPGAPVEEEMIADEMMVSKSFSNDEAAVVQIQDERKVIYNANMALVVGDTETAAKDIEALASSLGGYVANMNAYRGNKDVVFVDLTIRVPFDQFDAVRAALREMAIRVDRESANTDDVTDQYYDVDARLRTLQATEEELLALLAETRARGGSVEDIMAIYRELTNIQSEIESLQGQLNRLDKLIAFSTIDIALQPDELSKPIATDWRPIETLRNASRALISALQGLVDVLIYFVVVVLPVLILLAIPVILVLLFLRWLIRRLQGRRKESS